MYTNESAKRFIVQMLVERNVVKTPEGFEFLQRHLNDNSVQDLVLAGLLHADLESRRQVATLVSNTLVQARRPANTGAILLTLGSWREDAQVAVPAIEAIFDDPEEEAQIRSLAAQAMLQIGPIVPVIQKLKAQDRHLVLGPIGFVGGQTNGQFDSDPESRRLVRQYVRDALRDRETQVRELAFQVLPSAYGENCIVADPANGYRVNPEFETTLRQVASDDPDELMRQRAQGVLDTLGRRIENAIRKRCERQNQEPHPGPP